MHVFYLIIYFLNLFIAGSPEDGGKPFQCPVCGLVIKRKSYWKRHMVIHTGLKSHQCPLCPFRCARKDNLKSHMKVTSITESRNACAVNHIKSIIITSLDADFFMMQNY